MVRKRIKFMIGLILLAVCFVYCLTVLVQPPATPTAWDAPVYQDGRWHLTGVAEELLRKEMFGVKIDLLRIRYGKGQLWAAAGAERVDGAYESFVNGAATREQVEWAFRFPRWVTLTVKGKPGMAGASDCTDPGPRCHLTRLAEREIPILLDGDDHYTDSASTIFVRTGVFPAHYLYGFLTWDIEPGQIIFPGLEGE